MDPRFVDLLKQLECFADRGVQVGGSLRGVHEN